jgi:hypothetical protein
MDMDDDDFMGKIEFDLSPEQRNVVSRAISLASNIDDDEFGMTNPLISIMQWWEVNVSETEKLRGSPETTLVEACRLFVLTREERRKE